MPDFIQGSETETEQTSLAGQAGQKKNETTEVQCPRAHTPCLFLQAETCTVYEKVRQLRSFLRPSHICIKTALILCEKVLSE